MLSSHQIHCRRETTATFSQPLAGCSDKYGGDRPCPFWGKTSVGSLGAIRRQFSLLEDDIQDSFRETVSVRDGVRCMFTESDDSVDVHWITPPSAYMGIPSPMGKPSLISEEDLKETSNLLPMRSDIHELWDSNSFSVDVDDEYRIRIFNQDALKAELPPRLKTVPTDKYMSAYLRIHFRQTLIVGLLGGDISYDHSPREVKRMTKALLNPESGENHVPFDDDRWKTDIGKEIFRYNFEETSQLETEAP